VLLSAENWECRGSPLKKRSGSFYLPLVTVKGVTVSDPQMF